MERLSTIFAKNRAEELPDDLWDNYVLPLSYPDNDLLSFSKSTITVGGRGTGKTMFLKYHCYPTIFSSKREKITAENLKQIGIHWRPDTSFTQMITEKYLEKRWKPIFETYIGLSIFIEFSRMSQKFYNSNFENVKLKEEILSITMPGELKELFKQSEDMTFSKLEQVCHYYRSQLSDWINFPEGTPPIHFTAKEKWLYFINYILKQYTPFNDTTFHIFIDEFENLTSDQQIIINTWIKHSESPLIFHIAYKKHAKVTSDTLSDEKIVNVNDYRVIDLEKIYADNFETLAAEIIMSKVNTFFNISNKHNLSDINSLEDRAKHTYHLEVTSEVKKIFPTLLLADIIDIIFQDSALSNKITTLIKDGLQEKKSSLSYKKFFDSSKKQETLLNGMLLHRKKIKPEVLLEHFEQNDKSFYQPLITNNLLGGILYLYSIYQNKSCPYFSGFERYILLSQSNIRHLLELCYQSIIELENNSMNQIKELDSFMIPPSLQADATQYTCKTQIDKISGLGNYGKDLQKIAVRLGKIFLLSQKRKSQSIAEINHFILKSYELSDCEDEKINTLINECKVWGILIEEKNNKKTSAKDSATSLYVLHPIYAAHFGISPRKKRKIAFTFNEFKTIFLGSETEYQKIHDAYNQTWNIDDQDTIAYNSNSLLDYIQ